MKLTIDHIDEIEELFKQKNCYRYLPDYNPNLNSDVDSEKFYNFEHQIFVKNYLGQLKNWSSFANKTKTSGIVCFQSEDEPSWYITDIYGVDEIKSIILEAIEYHENLNLYKFYLVLPFELINEFSLELSYYDYFDEIVVEEKTKCFFTTFWQILYKRILPSKKSIVRCYFMKKEFRKNIPLMSNI